MKKSSFTLAFLAIAVLPQFGFSETSEGQAVLGGEKTKYSTEGHPKAKGINIGIEYPSSWQRSESDMPNIVQEFTSVNLEGRFLMQCMVLIKNQPSFMKLLSSEDISDVMFTQETLKEIVPEGATFIKGDPTKYDGQPGAWMIYMMQSERAGLRAEMYILQHMFVYSGELITVQCGVCGLPESTSRLQEEFARYLPLFQLIGNSIVIEDKWEKTMGIADVLSEPYGEYWVIGLIISIIFTWGIGLSPPLLIRFAFVRHGLSKGWAIATVTLFGFGNFVIFTANAASQGRRIGGAFFLIALASYAILRKGAKKQSPKIPPAITDENSSSGFCTPDSS